MKAHRVFGVGAGKAASIGSCGAERFSRPKNSNETRSGTSCPQEFGDDEDWNALIRLFRKSGEAVATRTGKLREAAVAVAVLYNAHESNWPAYLAEHHVKLGRRGPLARSRFHSVFKHFLAIDGGADRNGVASTLSHVVDAWYETARDRDIDQFIGNRTLKEIAKEHRDRHSDKPIREERQNEFLRLLDLAPLQEMPMPEAVAGLAWFRPLCRVQDGKVFLIDYGQPSSQAWLEANAGAILAARGISVHGTVIEAARSTSMPQGDAVKREIVEQNAPAASEPVETADGSLKTVHGIVDEHKARATTKGPMSIREHLELDGPRTLIDEDGAVDRAKSYRQISRLVKPGGIYHDLVGSVYVLEQRRRGPAPLIDYDSVNATHPKTNAEVVAQIKVREAVAESTEQAASSKIHCHSRKGICRYGGCTDAGSCLAAAKAVGCDADSECDLPFRMKDNT